MLDAFFLITAHYSYSKIYKMLWNLHFFCHSIFNVAKKITCQAAEDRDHFLLKSNGFASWSPFWRATSISKCYVSLPPPFLPVNLLHTCIFTHNLLSLIYLMCIACPVAKDSVTCCEWAPIIGCTYIFRRCGKATLVTAAGKASFPHYLGYLLKLLVGSSRKYLETELLSRSPVTHCVLMKHQMRSGRQLGVDVPQVGFSDGALKGPETACTFCHHTASSSSLTIHY